MDCPSCDARMHDVLGGGWHCRACGMLFELHRSRSPSPTRDLLIAVARVLFVVAVGMAAGVVLTPLALDWPVTAADVLAGRVFDIDTLQKSLLVSAVIMFPAALTWASSGRSLQNLVAAVVLSAVFGAVGGYFAEDGQPLLALRIGAAGAGAGLIAWIFSFGGRRGRA